MRWKNGGGVTAEIAREPATGPYLYRLSQAEICVDGAFSEFPGYDRWIVVIEGAGIFLNAKKVEPLKPFRFSGDEHSYCKLIAGPVRDLGFIFERSRVSATMSYFECPPRLSPRETHYAYDLKSGDTYQSDFKSVARGLLISFSFAPG